MPLLRSCVFLVAALGLVGGCKLVDQRTFVAGADRPPVVVPPRARATPGPVPLVAIRFPSPPDDWTGPLRVAVDLARARKPDVLFTVDSATGAAGGPAASAARLRSASHDAGAIADAIVADGVDRLQVVLTASTEPALGAGSVVRVFVR